MTPIGWIIMIISISAVIGLVGFCFYRVLTLPPAEITEHLHAQPAIDTGDTEDAD